MQKVLLVITDGIGSNPNSACEFDAFKKAKTPNYDYLLKNGIEKSRLSYKGFGCTNMMHKNPKKEAQHMANRRIEIQMIYD